MPKEKMSYFAIPLGAFKQEMGKGAVVVWLITQHLHQLQQVLQQFLITVVGRKEAEIMKHEQRLQKTVF